jgi:hypothetical protein
MASSVTPIFGDKYSTRPSSLLVYGDEIFPNGQSGVFRTLYRWGDFVVKISRDYSMIYNEKLNYEKMPDHLKIYFTEIFEVGTFETKLDTWHYSISEYLDGILLGDYLSNKHEVEDKITGIINLLSFNGIILRDIHGGNFGLDKYGNLKIFDYGF